MYIEKLLLSKWFNFQLDFCDKQFDRSNNQNNKTNRQFHEPFDSRHDKIVEGKAETYIKLSKHFVCIPKSSTIEYSEGIISFDGESLLHKYITIHMFTNQKRKRSS